MSHQSRFHQIERRQMTLDEAIKHCTEAANRTDTCADCRAEHMQLANWLRELKEKRSENAVPVVRCKYCIYNIPTYSHGTRRCDKGYDGFSPNWFCADGKVRETHNGTN